MLMICDGVKPVAIAGVMGGLNSEIRDDTRIVLLESAYFIPHGNRRTAKQLGLETEAPIGLEEGSIMEGAFLQPIARPQLIQELAGGKVIEGVVDVYPTPIQPKPIPLSVRKIHQILGTEIPAPKVIAYLKDLELNVEEKEQRCASGYSSFLSRGLGAGNRPY